jgi:hypothetical protein
MTAGAPVEGLAGLPPVERTAAIRRAPARLVTITTSQVAGAAVWDLAQKGTREGWNLDHRALAADVLRSARRLMDQGVRLDPQMADDRWFERRWNRLIAFGRRRGLWRCEGGTIAVNPPRPCWRPAGDTARTLRGTRAGSWSRCRWSWVSD